MTKFQLFKISIIPLIISLLMVLVPFVNAQAAFSTTKTIGGCIFSAYVANASGKQVSTIASKTPFTLVIEWSPGVGNCSDFDSVEVGWYSQQGSNFSFYPQYCSINGELSNSKRVAKANFNTASDATISKYIIPKNGISVCNQNEKKTGSSKDALMVNGKVSTTTTVSNTNTSTSTNSNTNASTNSSTGTDTGPVENPDTSVKVTPGTNFDTVLGTFYNPLEDSVSRPEQLVVRIINILLLFVGILSVVMIILGGFRMVASGGSEAQIKKGKQTVIWAVGGLLVSLMAFSIVAIIQSIIS